MSKTNFSQNVADSKDLVRAAIWYGENKIPVFPLYPRGKKPLTHHGFKDAATDGATIRAWWRRWPDANIGVPTGRASGLLLLDLDFRNGSVVESRDELIEQFGAIPETAEVVSGSGGRHIYFKFPGVEVPKQIAKGVELKGEGGYAVVPPSIHPDGPEYTFDGINGRNAILKVADPPAWLLNAIENLKPRGRRPAATDTKKISEGGRNTALTSLAGKLRRAGLSGAGLEAALLEENQARCSPPLDDAEVRKIAASIARYPAGGSAPQLVTIDVSSLPPSVDMLNRLSIFAGRIAFETVRRCGRMVIATGPGFEAIWYSVADLMNFTRSQAILAGATSVVIPKPPKGRITAEWECAAQMFLRIAESDYVRTGEDLREEFSEIIAQIWTQNEFPTAREPADFVAILNACKQYKRDPRAGPARCTVFQAEDSCFIYQPALMCWLSQPNGRNRHYPRPEVNGGLALLGFKPETVHRSADGKSAKVNLWRRPDLLVDGETE
jgi:hypothetical protein